MWEYRAGGRGRWGLVEVGAEGVVWGLLRLRLRLGGAGGWRVDGDGDVLVCG